MGLNIEVPVVFVVCVVVPVPVVCVVVSVLVVSVVVEVLLTLAVSEVFAVRLDSYSGPRFAQAVSEIIKM